MTPGSRPTRRDAAKGRGGRAPAGGPTTRKSASRPRLNLASQTKSGQGERSRRPSLTGRAAVLALVVCMLAISLAYPLREYLAQRAEIADYETRVAAQTKRVAELETARKRWQDPAYVKAQARQRLHYVMPGETQYVVLDPDEAPAPVANRAASAAQAERRPWFGDIWHSVEVAGRT